MKRMGFAVLASLTLAGCSLSPLIRPAVVEYNQVEEDANNQILVTNILRARDNAPLYLAEFQTIHVSITGTIGTGNITVPFGRGKVPNAKMYSALPSASLQAAPTFDAVQLDTQQFTLGMLKPTDPQTWEYYWHRNYSPDILLDLFLASINQGTVSYNNNPCVSSSAKADCDAYDSFKSKVDQLAAGGVYLNIFTTLSPTPAGPQAKTVMIGDKTFTFEQSAPQVAICTQQQAQASVEMWKRLTRYQVDPCPTGGGGDAHVSPIPAAPGAAAAGDSKSLLATGAGGPSASGSALSPDDMALFACTHRQVVQCRRSWAEVQESSVEGGGYVLRSVDGIIRYLGRVQQVVDETPGPDSAKKGVTWTENGVQQTLFQLHREPGLDRIEVNYHGKRYYVREGDASDHTLEVLALLNQLINANKNASEIPTTRAVQIVP